MTKISFCSSPEKAFVCENEHILKKNYTKNFYTAFHDLESGFTQTLLTEINFQKYVDLNCVKLWSLTNEAPLKGHPQGVPCAELAVRSTDWGVSTYAENVMKRFYEKTSPPPNGGPPRTERSPLPCGHLPTPWGVTPFRGGLCTSLRGNVADFHEESSKSIDKTVKMDYNCKGSPTKNRFSASLP